VPFFKRRREVKPPAGTAQFIGRAKDPLPAAATGEIAAACAHDDRVLAAYLYWSVLALPGETPHHTVGLVLGDDVQKDELHEITDGIYARAAAALGQETLDFQILDDETVLLAQESVPPIFERRT